MTWVRYQETMQSRSEYLIDVPGEVTDKGDDAIAVWIEQHLEDRRRTSYSDPAEGDVDFEFLDYDVPPATVQQELAEREQALAAFVATLEATG